MSAMIAPEASIMPAGSGWDVAPMGDSGLLVSWRGPHAHEAVRSLQARFEAASAAEGLELVPGIDSALLCFDPAAHEPDRLQSILRKLLASVSETIADNPRIVTIEVVYGGEDGVDLPHVARSCGLTPDEVVALHTAGPMPVRMIGFMPGFPYVGGLPPALWLPRRIEPRVAVPAGSVALANDQTGIYPARSPGGWHIIGRTDARLFDPWSDPPSLLKPGDLVQFVAMKTG